MKRVCYAAPSANPVSWEELVANARIDLAVDMQIGEAMIAAATETAEQYCWSKFVTQTWDVYYDGFVGEALALPFPPAQSIVEVAYTDTNGVAKTISPSVYELSDSDGIGMVWPRYGMSWPNSRGSRDDAKVRYVCGYGNPQSVPAPIRHAILILATWMYEERTGGSREETIAAAEIPQAVFRLLDPFSFRVEG